MAEGTVTLEERIVVTPRHWPRFLTDKQLKEYLGRTDAALRRCRAIRDFPRRDRLTDRTDSKAVDLFFDRRSGLAPHQRGGDVAVAERRGSDGGWPSIELAGATCPHHGKL